MHKLAAPLVFASHNHNKVEEIRQILGGILPVEGLVEIGCYDDIPEPYETLEDNALAKARFVYRHFGRDCFADDTGLEAEALNGMPGVMSARYAGPGKDNRANMRKLISELAGQKNRRARFRTVIALIVSGTEHLFEGIVSGRIADEPRGDGGFGYDPVFVPEGYTITFGEMAPDKKNRISHRWAAIEKLSGFLKNG